MTQKSSVKLPTDRFTIQRAIQGWLVVDRDGRPVSDLTSQSSASKMAENLNTAAFGGSKTLHRAFERQIT